MLAKQRQEQQVSDQKSGELIPEGFEPTISGASFLISLIALFLAHRSNRRSDKVERINQFEREYGSELREAFRQFESGLAELDAFVFPSARSPAQQCDELSGVASELEITAAKIMRILGELDDDETVQWTDWLIQFKRRSDQAEQNIAGALQNAGSQPILFQRMVARAQDEYKSAVSVIRRRLRRAAGKKRYPK